MWEVLSFEKRALIVAPDLHDTDAMLLNWHPVTQLLRDWIVTFGVLRGAGVPDAFVASHVSQLLPALGRGPLIIEPCRSRKQGSAAVRDQAELAALGPLEEPGFTRRYPPPDEPVSKFYSIDGELFGAPRVRATRTYHGKLGQSFTLSAQNATLGDHVTPSASPAWQGAAESRVQTPGTATPADVPESAFGR